MKTRFSIKASASPRDVGIWLQSIMLANPETAFVVFREDRDICLGVVGNGD